MFNFSNVKKSNLFDFYKINENECGCYQHD